MLYFCILLCFFGRIYDSTFNHRLYRLFHQAMEQARINGMIAVNPTDGTTLPRREQNEMRVLSLEEER